VTGGRWSWAVSMSLVVQFLCNGFSPLHAWHTVFLLDVDMDARRGCYSPGLEETRVNTFHTHAHCITVNITCVWVWLHIRHYLPETSDWLAMCSVSMFMFEDWPHLVALSWQVTTLLYTITVIIIISLDVGRGWTQLSTVLSWRQSRRDTVVCCAVLTSVEEGHSCLLCCLDVGRGWTQLSTVLSWRRSRMDTVVCRAVLTSVEDGHSCLLCCDVGREWSAVTES